MTHSSTDNNVKSGATIADSLKYAELQMAAEAFLVDNKGKLKKTNDLREALIEGNNRASKFTKKQAEAFFAKGWEIVAQCPNTASGFSGTLFRAYPLG